MTTFFGSSWWILNPAHISREMTSLRCSMCDRKTMTRAFDRKQNDPEQVRGCEHASTQFKKLPKFHISQKKMRFSKFSLNWPFAENNDFFVDHENHGKFSYDIEQECKTYLQVLNFHQKKELFPQLAQNLIYLDFSATVPFNCSPLTVVSRIRQKLCVPLIVIYNIPKNPQKYSGQKIFPTYI